MVIAMKKEIDENVLYLIYSLIEEIPEGRVATYGQIAKLIGKENHSRFVGRALKMSHLYGEYPCHRVVIHKGRVVIGWDEQITLLKAENIAFKDEYHVDLNKHQWKV